MKNTKVKGRSFLRIFWWAEPGSNSLEEELVRKNCKSQECEEEA